MMSYRIAAVDVHKKMLAVVVTDVDGEGEYEFERRKFGATPGELRVLAQWLHQQEVEEVVMESTAQYWKPVWAALEQYWKAARQKREGAPKMAGTLHLCQAKSNHGPRGRKNDFLDGERMIKRLVAEELVLSFVPDPEQRLWRTVTRRKHQLTRAKVVYKTGESVGTGAPQVVELCVGPSGRQCATHVAGTGEWGNGPGRAGGSGRLPAAGHAGRIARRAGRLHGPEWNFPSASADGAG
jgi:hypothetical protein